MDINFSFILVMAMNLATFMLKKEKGMAKFGLSQN